MSDEQSQPQATEIGQEDHHAEQLIESLPPAEKQKWNEKFIQLEYYKAISQTVLQILKDFSKWAALLVSGIGTLIGGWFSFQKMAKKGRADLRSMHVSQPGRARLDSGVRSAQAPVITRESSNLEAIVEASVTPTVEAEISTNMFADTTVIMTIISISLFIGMLVKMFIFDKRRKAK